MTTRESGLRKREFYIIESEDRRCRTKVLATRSVQYNPYDRHLTISATSRRRLEKLAPGATWYCVYPTPYRPRCVFEIAGACRDASNHPVVS